MCLTEKDYLKKYDIRVLIISRGRAQTITTTKILPSYIEVLVPESEKQEYEQVCENPILTIPDEVEGLGAVRNWVLRNFKENTIIMADDDINVCYCLTGAKSRRIDDPEEVMQIIINTAVMANDMGVKYFDFAQTDIRKYNGCDPFDLCTWVGCVIGVIGRKYEFRNDKFKVDIDFALQSLLVERVIFQDSRYWFSQIRNSNIGGNSKFRDADSFKKSVDTLKKKWGDCIKVNENFHDSDVRITLNVKRRQRVDYR